MPEMLEFTLDKFTFKVATDRLYTGEGLWVKVENTTLRVGISDFLQQRSGDVAFAEIKPMGTALAAGDELAVIETIKVNISLSTPVAGRVVEVNPAMESAPEIINQDPYGEGWLAVIEPLEGGATQMEQLMEPDVYFTQIKGDAEQEVGRG
jgi:glycine cleavage system H protein